MSSQEQSDKLIAKVLVYGDIHLSSKNYGSHREYPMESLTFFRNITQRAKEIRATHIIGTGDLTYGRFNTLEYRKQVEKELEEQNEITNGNRFEVEGNHDSASYGMTEYEYYIDKGLLKPSTKLALGNANITMINYGESGKTEIITPDASHTNIVIMHDFFKFSDSNIADYGKAMILDSFEPWYGVDYVIGGHIHNWEVFKGSIAKNGIAYPTVVHYLGCPNRPAYRPGSMQDTGNYAIISVYEDRTEYDVDVFPLWDIAKSFNLEAKEERENHTEQKRVDVSDIVHRLDAHKRVVGEPSEVIMALENIKLEYREKAVQLLKECQA